MAGQAWADWLLMGGLLGIGVALIAGVAMRIAAASGAPARSTASSSAACATTHEPALYVERRTSEGLSEKEIIGCLKRYITREIYCDLTAPAA